MTTWCVDANVVIATLLQENATPAARAFWSGLSRADEVIAAQVLLPECTAALRRKVVDGSITEAEGRQLVEDMLALPVVIEQTRDQFRMAFDWALAMRRRRMHDLQYLAVAILRRAQLVTIDSGLRQAAQERGVAVRFLR